MITKCVLELHKIEAVNLSTVSDYDNNNIDNKERVERKKN